jgi:hypothetical protein
VRGGTSVTIKPIVREGTKTSLQRLIRDAPDAIYASSMPHHPASEPDPTDDSASAARFSSDYVPIWDEATVVAASTLLWMHWARIAKKQLALARAAADARGPDVNVIDEMYPSLLTICACAHSLDGLYGLIREHDPMRKPGATGCERGKPRHSHIVETFKTGTSDGSKYQRWQKEIPELFKTLRNPAVHPALTSGPPQAHPRRGHMAPEYVTYRLETAQNAYDLLVDVVRALVESPRIREPLGPVAKDLLSELAGQSAQPSARAHPVSEGDRSSFLSGSPAES